MVVYLKGSIRSWDLIEYGDYRCEHTAILICMWNYAGQTSGKRLWQVYGWWIVEIYCEHRVGGVIRRQIYSKHK